MASLFEKTAVDKQAWSKSIKNEVIKRWGKSPNMMDEAGLDQFLDNVEKLVPAGAKSKAYMLYLCSQYFPFTPPAWEPGHDDSEIRPLMFNFDKLVTGNKLTGKASDLQSYKMLDQLKKAVKGASEVEGPKKENDESAEQALATEDRFSIKRTRYLPEDLEIIKSGSTIIANHDGWACYKIKHNPDQGGEAAGFMLCNNGINDVSWCVGRKTNNYFKDGPFYVMVKGGKSRYAISTHLNRDATIWNPADTPIWQTAGSEGRFPHIEAAAQAKGLNVDLEQISSLPHDIIGILEAATKVDPELAKVVPAEHIVEPNPETVASLDKAIMASDIKGLVGDLSVAYSSDRSLGKGAAVLGRCVQMHYDFSPEYSEFTENLLIGYIEALAGAGQKLPQSLEDAIVEAIQASA